MNVFADKDRDLPPGWEAKLDRNGKVNIRFYSNHLIFFLILFVVFGTLLKNL